MKKKIVSIPVSRLNAVSLPDLAVNGSLIFTCGLCVRVTLCLIDGAVFGLGREGLYTFATRTASEFSGKSSCGPGYLSHTHT